MTPRAQELPLEALTLGPNNALILPPSGSRDWTKPIAHDRRRPEYWKSRL